MKILPGVENIYLIRMLGSWFFLLKMFFKNTKSYDFQSPNNKYIV